ncbi:hypothetical protein INR49_022708 [Caranx melampygus]|nr:hypothetical protein INR49_022708 [Caranx melampygus]
MVFESLPSFISLSLLYFTVFILKVMSCRLPSPTFLLLLLFLLRVQSIDLTHNTDFEFPEIDGSAVDDTCRIFPVLTPSPFPTRKTATTAKPHPSPRRPSPQLRSRRSGRHQRNQRLKTVEHQSGHSRLRQDQSQTTISTLQPASSTSS